MMRFLLFFLIFSFRFLDGKTVIVRNNESFFVTISDFFSKKDYKSVVNFYKNQDPVNFDNESKILVAQSLRMMSNFEDSIDLLRSINLSDNDVYLKVKFQLALTYYEARDFDAVIKNLDDFIEKSKDVKIDKKITEYVDQLKINSLSQKEKSSKIFYGSIGTSYMYDTNPSYVNTGNIYVYQLQMYQNPSPDYGYLSSGNIGYNYDFNRNVSIFGSASVSYLRYNNTANRDNLRFNGSQGIAYKYNNWTFGLPINYSSVFFGRDAISDLGYNFDSILIYSASPFVDYRFNKYFSSRTSLQVMYKDVNIGIKRNGIFNGLSQQFQINITNYTALYLNGTFAFEQSNVKQYTNFLYSGGLTLRQYIPGMPIYLDVGYNYSKLAFQSVDPMFSVTRNDSFHNASASINFIIFKYLDIYIRYTYSKNISNVKLYTFDRQTIGGGLKLVF